MPVMPGKVSILLGLRALLCQLEASELVAEGVSHAWGCSASIFQPSSHTGKERMAIVYFNQETKQQWAAGTRMPDDAGGALWLPDGVQLELVMLPAVRQASSCVGRGLINLQQYNCGTQGMIKNCVWALQHSSVLIEEALSGLS